jgi:hypothetical protein
MTKAGAILYNNRIEIKNTRKSSTVSHLYLIFRETVIPGT